MRFISADYIFPISSAPIKNGVVVIDNAGKIVAVHDSLFKVEDTVLEKHNGIICPGFINAHCHLELSHMKGKIEEGLGMAGFIKGVLTKRNTSSQEQIVKAIERVDDEMYTNGIVGVGDISNDNSTVEQKTNSKIKYHTFFEVFDLDPSKAVKVFDNAKSLKHEYVERMNEAGVLPESSIVPHAPYTVSPELFKLISLQRHNTLISYHNQESVAESELYINKKGSIADMFSSIGIKLDYINAQGKNSLQSTLPYFSMDHKVLFVHNTYTSKDDIKLLTSYFSHPTFCFCPNANLYIEDRLPDIDFFLHEGADIVVGTDSLASNHSLSILDELKTIAKHFPEIPTQTLFTWATKNGAEFFGWQDNFGTLEVGKTPGIVLIENVDLGNIRVTDKSSVRRLL